MSTLCVQLADAEARMVTVLDDLGLTTLVTSIAGLTPVGAATILAEAGDLTRFRSPRSVVKHAGLCPRENSSGQHQGKSADWAVGERDPLPTLDEMRAFVDDYERARVHNRPCGRITTGQATACPDPRAARAHPEP